MSCSSEKGKPPPIYRWKRVASSPDIFFPPAQGKVGPGGFGQAAGPSTVGGCRGVGPQEVEVGWRRVGPQEVEVGWSRGVGPQEVAVGWRRGGGPRWGWQRPTFSPADEAKGTLKLTNLSLAMSGVYVCSAENQGGSAECSIVMEVHSSEYVSSGAGQRGHARSPWGPWGMEVVGGGQLPPPPPLSGSQRQRGHRRRRAGLPGRCGHRHLLRPAGGRLPAEET